MAKSRQQKGFLPPTIEERAKALGQTNNVSIKLFVKLKGNYLWFLVE